MPAKPLPISAFRLTDRAVRGWGWKRSVKLSPALPRTGGMEPPGEFVEVKPASRADALDRRPVLAAALETARKAKARTQGRCPVIVAGWPA